MIIAEIGQNHCGDMELARRLIWLAEGMGADLAKFQLYDHKILYKDHPEIPNVELSFDQAKMLFDYGEEVGIEVFFSVFDVERVKWCEEIGVKRYKIATLSKSELVLDAVYATNKPVIISVSDPFHRVPKVIPSPHKYLYCVPHYPAQLDGLHLENVPFDFMDGFSDHTIGLDASKIALARGAEIIEKHFAIDHKTGVDAEWSMTPDELQELKRWELVCREVL